MEGNIIELSKYRFSNAKEDLESAQLLLGDGKYKASANRSYYAIFHALRSVTALDQFDSNKHSGIISYFNKHYVKEKSLNAIVEEAIRKYASSESKI